MEVYFKDLISEDKSLEKLVDDLERVVQGADDFAQAVEQNLSQRSRQEVAHRLDRLKHSYRRLSSQAMAGARATDRLVRQNPYASFGIALGLGILLGLRWRRRD